MSPHAGLTREKLTANVSFPLKGLKLSDYSSKEAVIDEDDVECVLSFPLVFEPCRAGRGSSQIDIDIDIQPAACHRGRSSYVARPSYTAWYPLHSRNDMVCSRDDQWLTCGGSVPTEHAPHLQVRPVRRDQPFREHGGGALHGGVPCAAGQGQGGLVRTAAASRLLLQVVGRRATWHLPSVEGHHSVQL